MTRRLQQAFELAAQLTSDEQDKLAERLLAELQGDDEFDRKIADTAHKLAPLIEEAITEYRAGITQPIVNKHA